MAALEATGVVVTIAAGGVAVIAGTVAAARAAWRANRRVVRVFDAILGDGTADHPGIVRQVEEIRAEVTLNGGRSLKDEVLNTRQDVQELRRMLDGHLTWHINGGAVDPTVSLTHPTRGQRL